LPKYIEDDAIFRAVIQIITERGYSGATTKQIAEAANVSEVTLFRKYENKLQMVKRAIASTVEDTNFYEATQYTGDVQADLLRVLQAYQASVVLHGPFFVMLFSEVSRDPELARSFDQPVQLFEAVGKLFQRYQAEGELREEHPLHAVAEFLGPFIYSAMLRSLMPEHILPPLDEKQHIRLFLEGRFVRST
jgi:TetR/AcrR family transcriptional regulator